MTSLCWHQHCQCQREQMPEGCIWDTDLFSHILHATDITANSFAPRDCISNPSNAWAYGNFRLRALKAADLVRAHCPCHRSGAASVRPLLQLDPPSWLDQGFADTKHYLLPKPDYCCTQTATVISGKVITPRNRLHTKAKYFGQACTTISAFTFSPWLKIIAEFMP